MSLIAGIDYSTRFVDVVTLEEEGDWAQWHRWVLSGADAFDRSRSVRDLDLRRNIGWLIDEHGLLAVGIEEPRGYNAGALYRIQGAILGCIPTSLLVQPWLPQSWRKQVGLPGNASKEKVKSDVWARISLAGYGPLADEVTGWPFDATDAYCIALATRSVLQREENAA